MAVVTLAEMMEAGAHFGHQTRRWNPKMSRYIFDPSLEPKDVALHLLRAQRSSHY